ncbi:MAG: hypothetical protein KA885_07345 [Spirochaetes bacterium]|nr:hypothetical protein [Spirochaetota bacterium]
MEEVTFHKLKLILFSLLLSLNIQVFSLEIEDINIIIDIEDNIKDPVGELFYFESKTFFLETRETYKYERWNLSFKTALENSVLPIDTGALSDNADFLLDDENEKNSNNKKQIQDYNFDKTDNINHNSDFLKNINLISSLSLFFNDYKNYKYSLKIFDKNNSFIVEAHSDKKYLDLFGSFEFAQNGAIFAFHTGYNKTESDSALSTGVEFGQVSLNFKTKEASVIEYDFNDNVFNSYNSFEIDFLSMKNGGYTNYVDRFFQIGTFYAFYLDYASLYTLMDFKLNSPATFIVNFNVSFNFAYKFFSFSLFKYDDYLSKNDFKKIITGTEILFDKDYKSLFGIKVVFNYNNFYAETAVISLWTNYNFSINNFEAFNPDKTDLYLLPSFYYDFTFFKLFNSYLLYIRQFSSYSFGFDIEFREMNFKYVSVSFGSGLYIEENLSNYAITNKFVTETKHSPFYSFFIALDSKTIVNIPFFELSGELGVKFLW